MIDYAIFDSISKPFLPTEGVANFSIAANA